MSISRKNASFIRSLQQKKYRKQEQRFVVEGAKSVLELLASDFVCDAVVCTEDFLDEHQNKLQDFSGEITVTTSSDLQQVSEYKTNNAALAVAHTKPNKMFELGVDEFGIVLDDIRDPGNLGTILRAGDWYGISKVIASEETADFYNSKVIQASMGSFTRVQIFYTNLPQYLGSCGLPILGTFLDGEDIHHYSFPKQGLIVIGNEANGISTEVESCVTTRITIPRYGRAESLNAAMATAIVCDNIRRGV